MRNYKIASLLMMLVCFGCATSPVGPQRVDLADSNVSTAPSTIMEDAAKLSGFTIFPKTVSSDITKIIDEGGNSKEAKRKVHRLICQSNEPRFTPTVKVKVIPPRVPAETPFDKATESRKEFLFLARIFLQTRFFYTLAHGPNGAEGYRKDFSDYIAAKASGREDQLRGINLDIPIAAGQEIKLVAKFYQDLRYLPAFLEKRWIENIYSPDFHIDFFFNAIFFSSNSAVLVPKAGTFLSTGFDRYNGVQLEPTIGVFHINEQRGDEGIPPLDSGRNDTLYKNVPLTISKQGWKVADGSTVYPMQVSYSKELSYIVNNFTFVLSREVIEKELNINNKLVTQHLGLDFYTEKFRPQTAIKGKDFIFEQYFKQFTSLKEAPQENGVVEYQVSLDLGLFCSHGISLGDLLSD